MKKLIIVLLLNIFLLSFSSYGFAEKININLWGGYASVSMNDVNKILDSDANTMKSIFDSFSGSYNITLSKSTGVLLAGVDGGYKIFSNLSFGPRISYLSSESSLKIDATSVIELTDDQGNPIEEHILFSDKLDKYIKSSLISILIGGSYEQNILNSISISAGVYAGYGLANSIMSVNNENTYSIQMNSAQMNAVAAYQPPNFEIPYIGSGVIFDISIKGYYRIIKFLSVNLNLSYRIANIPEVKSTKDEIQNDTKKGDLLKDQNGNTVKLNFSGLTAGVGISYNY